MVDEEQNEIVVSPANKLVNTGNDLINEIINESDPDKVEDLTNLFKLNQKKRDIARINKLSNLLDNIDKEVIDRINNVPESFKNETLLAYMESTQKSITNIQQNVEQTPLIQINNQKNEINISDSGLNRESRQKVLDAVMAILNNTDVIDVESKEKGN